MIDLENRQVVDAEWRALDGMFAAIPEEIGDKLRGRGFEEMSTGTFVPEEDAFNYALERVSQDEGEKKEFVEWFYSNWVKE